MQNISKLVSSRLRASEEFGSAGAPGHPDAESLSAFAEQALSLSEREELLSHLSRCEECREIVSLAMPPAAVPPPDERAEVNWADKFSGHAGPERARSPQRSALPAVKKNRWLGFAWPNLERPNYAWGALAAGVAVAASLIFLHPLSPRPGNSPAANANLAFSAPATSTLSTASSTAASPAPSLASGIDSAGSSPDQKRRTTQAKSLSANETLLAKSELPAAPQSGARAIRKAKPVPADREALDNTPSEDNRIRAWRIEDGNLQRSIDGGRSWRSSLSPEHRVLCFASGGTEIWAGAEGGMLLHSSDNGSNWTHTKLPPDLGGDIIRIDWLGNSIAGGGNDSGSINLFTSKGETWSSTDAGNSWNRD